MCLLHYCEVNIRFDSAGDRVAGPEQKLSMGEMGKATGEQLERSSRAGAGAPLMRALCAIICLPFIRSLSRNDIGECFPILALYLFLSGVVCPSVTVRI